MSLRVVYVDDEPELCQLFVDLFSMDKVDIVTFIDPILALESANRNPPDLMFLDFRMPKMNGDDLAFALDPKIPKALITGEIMIVPKYPFLSVSGKPFDIKGIASLIQTHASGKK